MEAFATCDNLHCWLRQYALITDCLRLYADVIMLDEQCNAILDIPVAVAAIVDHSVDRRT
jgi:hypothetical protein